MSQRDGVRFSSPEELARWAESCGVKFVSLGAGGEVREVMFHKRTTAPVAPVGVPDFAGLEDDDREQRAPAASDVDQALDRMMRRYPAGGARA